MSNYEFATGVWRDYTKYSCYECNYYTLEDRESVLRHCEITGHGKIQHGGKNDAAFVRSQLGVLAGLRITLGFLCWNTRQVSVEGMQELWRESGRLHTMGVQADIVVIDNGSTDGTDLAMEEYVASLDYKFGNILIVRLNENVGISKARNLIIQRALVDQTDYVLFLDGDIQIVPFSVYAMAKYMVDHLAVGCIGAFAAGCTTDGKDATRRLYELHDHRVGSDIKCAWTQYGLFRREMFSQGVKFDEDGPFGLPGWGFEDDDLCFQMVEAGWENHYFRGCTYLHRSLRSSWPSLKAAGVDIHRQFMERRAYLLKKWKSNSRIRPWAGIVEAQREPETYGRAFR